MHKTTNPARRLSLATFVGFIVATVASCANPGIVQLSPDTYMLAKEDHAGIFGSMAKLKSDVISQANAFAARQGKVAIPLASHEKPVGMGPAQWASFEYQFRVVDPNDPEAKRTALIPRPDMVIDKTEKITVDEHTRDDSPRTVDVYTELLKLDDLRKKGIISEEEFQTQKAKLLGAN
jgi:hypothetical protein